MLEGTIFEFIPVPLDRKRHDGWSAVLQARFVEALSAMGSVGAAVRAVGKSRASAYRLRERAGAESFAHAWDVALQAGRSRQFDYAMERAIDGVTTITVRRGGNVDVVAGPDGRIMNAAIRAQARAEGW